LQLLKSTITAALPALFEQSSECSYDVYSQSLAAIMPAALPDKHDYCNDVHMATVRSASALCLHLLDSLKKSSSSESVTNMLSLLQPASVVLLSACPVSCYDLLVTYLKSCLADKAAVLTTADLEFVESRRFCSLLPEVITEPVKAVACHPNIAKLQEMTTAVQAMSGSLLLFVNSIGFFS